MTTVNLTQRELRILRLALASLTDDLSESDDPRDVPTLDTANDLYTKIDKEIQP